MAAFRKGDIVIFPFPYTDLTSRKIRPCLVISDEMDEDILLCQITSTKIKRDALSVALSRKETVKGTLSIDSLIRCNMIFTANKKQIIKKICEINNRKYNQVVSIIKKIVYR